METQGDVAYVGGDYGKFASHGFFDDLRRALASAGHEKGVAGLHEGIDLFTRIALHFNELHVRKRGDSLMSEGGIFDGIGERAGKENMFVAWFEHAFRQLFPACREVDSARKDGRSGLVFSRSEDAYVPVGAPHGKTGERPDEGLVEVGTMVGNDDGNKVLERGEESGKAVVRVDEVRLERPDLLFEGTEVAEVADGSLPYYREEVDLASQEAQRLGLLHDEWGKTAGVM